MQLSDKNKYYLIKIYNAVKIIGNICAVIIFCLWIENSLYFIPKGGCAIRYILMYDFCVSKDLIEQIIFGIIEIYICWQMMKKMLKVHSLKYHIKFWLTPFIVAIIQIVIEQGYLWKWIF